MDMHASTPHDRVTGAMVCERIIGGSRCHNWSLAWQRAEMAIRSIWESGTASLFKNCRMVTTECEWGGFGFYKEESFAVPEQRHAWLQAWSRTRVSPALPKYVVELCRGTGMDVGGGNLTANKVPVLVLIQLRGKVLIEARGNGNYSQSSPETSTRSD